ncbi:CPLN1 protein, partial [Eubucco bourcierii]|nr:CPLN1 protein [Eubucco bourcierii]
NVLLSRLENCSEETGFMPLSKDLHSSTPAKPVHLLASSATQKTPKLIPIEKNINYSCGFPLLKLKSDCHFKPAFLHPIEMSSARPPLVPRVAWSSSDALQNHQSSYTPRKNNSKDLNMSRGDPEIPKQMHVEKRRWAETVHKRPPRHLNLDQYEGQQRVSPQQEFSEDVSMDKSLMTQNPAGIPLLHLGFDSVPRLLPVLRQPLTTTVKPAT